MTEVMLADPSRTNLLAIFLRSLIKKGLSDPRIATRTREASGALVIQSGAMSATIQFGETILIERGAISSPRAQVKAALPVLLAISRGASPIWLWLFGEVSFSGSLLFLWKLLPLLQCAREAP